jgi:CHASE3 domain sensor protein
MMSMLRSYSIIKMDKEMLRMRAEDQQAHSSNKLRKLVVDQKMKGLVKDTQANFKRKIADVQKVIEKEAGNTST